MGLCGGGIDPGTLNERVTLQNPTSSRTATGSPRLGWSTTATVWASVYGMSARDVVMSMQSQSLITHKIFIRFRDDVNAETRIVWRGATLEIVSHLPRYERTFIEILAREVEDGI